MNLFRRLGQCFPLCLPGFLTSSALKAVPPGFCAPYGEWKPMAAGTVGAEIRLARGTQLPHSLIGPRLNRCMIKLWGVGGWRLGSREENSAKGDTENKPHG